MKEEIIRKVQQVMLIGRLIFTMLFVGLAVYHFVQGNSIEGVLWLILAQLYDNKGVKK